MNSAIKVAKYVINRCIDLQNPISNLQLQKILYYLQGNFYAKYGEKLFKEKIEAWKYGPVIPEVYYEFNRYSSSPIRDKFEIEDLEINCDKLSYIDEIIKSKYKLTAWELVEKTHEEEPWKSVYDESYNNIISTSAMKEFFIAQQNER